VYVYVFTLGGREDDGELHKDKEMVVCMYVQGDHLTRLNTNARTAAKIGGNVSKTTEKNRMIS